MRWIIGDVHGMLRPLETLLAEVRRVDSKARFYFVGDYVNRGPSSREVIDLLIALGRDDGAKFVRGNHDDIVDEILHGKSYATNASDSDRLVAFQWFMQHGLDDTFMSYGIDLAVLEQCRDRPTSERLEKIIAPVPEAHRKFFRELPPVIEEEDFFVVHAWWDPDEPDHPPALGARVAPNAGARHKLIWGRYGEHELGRVKAWKRTGYFGHTPVFAYAASQTGGELAMIPIAGERMVLLDTGAALNTQGRLT
ncbi:MAG TPA: metallophosphoesterase, partial [Tepidisphaeraceae bacterium]|nr:metallophosphoesterase [Tepidisphaeraceae bacterium]